MEFLTLLEDPENVSSTVAFVYGVIFALVIVLLILLWSLVRHRRREQPLRLPSESGEMILTANAIKEFVERVVSAYNESSLKWVKMRTARGSLSLHIGIAVVPGTAVVPLVQKIREELQKKAQTELGVEEAIRINVTVKSLSAKDKSHSSASSTGQSAPFEQESSSPSDTY